MPQQKKRSNWQVAGAVEADLSFRPVLVRSGGGAGPGDQRKDETMKNWRVSYAGEYVGDVQETSEEYARCAAYSKFEPVDYEGCGTWHMDLLSVSRG